MQSERGSMAEPEYIYHPGIGWVPTYETNMWAPWAGLTGEVPEDIWLLIKNRVFKPEMFVEFLKLIGPSLDRDVVFGFVKEHLFCSETRCEICPDNFNGAWDLLTRKFAGECMADCHLTERLENLFNFWSEM